jgi:hypothetical protein
LNASIGLLRRAVISGNIQAVVGVDIFDESGNPILGAEVYVDDVLVGLTGSAWGTDGYLKFYHTSGDYSLRTESGNLSADSSVTFGVLGVTNYNLIIDEEVRLIEVASIPTRLLYDWESFEVEGESFLALSNYGSWDSYFSTTSPIYRWEGDSLVLHQNITTNNASAWRHHVISGEHYLFVANYKSGSSSRSTNSKLFKWDGAEFVLHQNIATVGTHGADFATINGEHFLIVANTTNNSGNHNIDSYIHKWNSSTEKFEFIQNIPTVGGHCSEAFLVDNELYLFLTNIYGSTSSIYKWNGTTFTPSFVISVYYRLYRSKRSVLLGS